MLLINEVITDLDHDSPEEIRHKLCKRLHIKEKELKSFKLYRRSLDTRKNPLYSYQVLIETDHEESLSKRPGVSVFTQEDTSVANVQRTQRPLVVGYGPAGIFAAYRLVEAGFKPLIFEKGKRIREREKDVDRFFKTGQLNPSSNVQFGEGGAGTFSDAKLTTRVKHPFIPYILDTFIRFGAKEDIGLRAHSHIGTDKIRMIISDLTDYLIERGAEFHFEEEMEELLLDECHRFIGIRTAKGTYDGDVCFLALGHSAYESMKMLKEKGVAMERKDVAIGFRVEHPQAFIDERQYNGFKHPKLEASEYFLRHQDEKGVYSFCMCPGGLVVPANSEEETIVTNGMSYSGRDSTTANSALLIQVPQSEFPDGLLGGYELLHAYERQAYQISKSYKALAMNIEDYMNHQLHPLKFESTYPLGTCLFDFHQLFNERDNEILQRAFLDFDRKIPGFIEKGIMVGPETRSSCPIRIVRDMQTIESINTPGLYPLGEGAGYGGGIMSCSLDGIRGANAYFKKLHIQ